MVKEIKRSVLKIQMTSFVSYSFLFSIVLFSTGVSAQLSPTFYDSSCPSALNIIQKATEAAVKNERRMGASLLRLQFHDCFVNGCDGSILLDDTPNMKGEKGALSSTHSLRGFEVIDNIKSQLESACPKTFSCSDILTVVARDASVLMGGPSWNVQLGRRDSTTANFTAVEDDIPPPFADLNFLLALFTRKGFTPKELVVLSGSHTIGQARCKTYRFQIYNQTNVDPKFAESLRKNCPSNFGHQDEYLAPLDYRTTETFDNMYFKNLIEHKATLLTDQVLYNNASTDSFVKTYSLDSNAFFTDFGEAMIKLGTLSPLTGSNGEIRIDCRKANS